MGVDVNGGTAPEVYREVAFPRKLALSRGNVIRFKTVERVFSSEADAADILARASDQEAIRLISAKATEQIIGGGGRHYDGLYIITEVGNDAVCKIGISFRPTHRLEQLQIATWRELRIAAVFYPVKANIETLEQLVHYHARQNGLSVRGEWLRVTPEEATRLIIDTAHRTGRFLCGPDVWMENLAARVYGMRTRQADQRTAA